jgi:hypothetical protein
MPLMSSGNTNCIDAAARFLAAEPGAAERALENHRRSPDGRCAGCRTRPVDWPCSTASIALAAQALPERR